MRSEDEEYSVESDPNERCAHSQTDRQRNVNPVSLRRRIDEIRDDPGWRLKTWSKEHGLCCRCHRLRCNIGTLRHSDSNGQYCSACTVTDGSRNNPWVGEEPFIYAMPRDLAGSCGVFRSRGLRSVLWRGGLLFEAIVYGEKN